MNGQITEVKQPKQITYSKMGDHLGSMNFVFLCFCYWPKY